MPRAEWDDEESRPEYREILPGRFPVGAGDLLGPLPHGTYEFDVWLGPSRIGTAKGTMRPGRIDPLVIAR